MKSQEFKKTTRAQIEIAANSYYTILRYIIKSNGQVNIQNLVVHVASEKEIDANELMDLVTGITTIEDYK